MKNLKILFFVMLIAGFSACKKEDSTKEMSHVNIHMTDAPGPYAAVNVDVQQVLIMKGNGEEVALNARTGMYNLLDLTNGKEVLLADGDIDAGTVSQIRLVLGSNNTVKVGDATYPLNTPSAQESGLKILVNKSLAAGVTYSFVLDFDASKSIVTTGNGTYQLKPVIRSIDNAVSGSVKGVLAPVGILSTITLVSNSNADISYTTNADASGMFLLQGVSPGIYTLTVTPVLPYVNISVTNVNVTVGNVTDVGTVTIITG